MAREGQHFVRALVRHGIVSVDELHARIEEHDDEVAERVLPRVNRLTSP